MASPNRCCLIGQPELLLSLRPALAIAVLLASPNCCCFVGQPLTVAVFIGQHQPLLSLLLPLPFWWYLGRWAVQF